MSTLFSTENWEVRRSPKAEQVNRPNDDRSPFERDRARIVHSAGFRRLQAKTQVLGISEGDFHRTRLTHSMEVAQIATGIGAKFRKSHHKDLAHWLPERALLEAVCFAHDLGHPPFGHGGERALNNALLTSPLGQNGIGFEGNGQTLRLLTLLEAHTPRWGLDLTRRTLLGVLKYPVPYSTLTKQIPEDQKPVFFVNWSEWKPPKCYLDTEAEWVNWMLEPLPSKDRIRFTKFDPPKDGKHGRPIYKSLDCSIMDVADEIAYGVHDFEDGVALKLISRTDWDRIESQYDRNWAESVGLPAPDKLADKLFAEGSESSAVRKEAVGALVNAMISSVRLERLFCFDHPLLEWNVRFYGPAKNLQGALQDVILDRIIKSQGVQTLEYRGQINLLALFRAIESDPEALLGGEFRLKVKQASSGPDRSRIIADYIAGMTDGYATRMFERVFVPRRGTIFDRL